MRAVRHILTDDRGASSIEYGLLAALVSLGIFTSASHLGAGVTSGMNAAGEVLEEAGKHNKGNADRPRNDKAGKKDKSDKRK